MTLIILFEEVAALVVNRSASQVRFSKVLRARLNKGHNFLPAIPCHSYTVNSFSTL